MLNSHPQVAESAVIAVLDPIRGEDVVGVLVYQPRLIQLRYRVVHSVLFSAALAPPPSFCRQPAESLAICR
jgi:hypothetical protein